MVRTANTFYLYFSDHDLLSLHLRDPLQHEQMIAIWYNDKSLL